MHTGAGAVQAAGVRWATLPAGAPALAGWGRAARGRGGQYVCARGMPAAEAARARARASPGTAAHPPRGACRAPRQARARARGRAVWRAHAGARAPALARAPRPARAAGPPRPPAARGAFARGARSKTTSQQWESKRGSGLGHSRARARAAQARPQPRRGVGGARTRARARANCTISELQVTIDAAAGRARRGAERPRVAGGPRSCAGPPPAARPAAVRGRAARAPAGRVPGHVGVQ